MRTRCYKQATPLGFFARHDGQHDAHSASHKLTSGPTPSISWHGWLATSVLSLIAPSQVWPVGWTFCHNFPCVPMVCERLEPGHLIWKLICVRIVGHAARATTLYYKRDVQNAFARQGWIGALGKPGPWQASETACRPSNRHSQYHWGFAHVPSIGGDKTFNCRYSRLPFDVRSIHALPASRRAPGQRGYSSNQDISWPTFKQLVGLHWS